MEAVSSVERYGVFCEAMYLMMAADGKVLNVEREVLRGALEILSEDQVRTVHMEAMLEAAGRASATQGPALRLRAVIEALLQEPRVKAELAVVLCAAVAIADGVVSDGEKALFEQLRTGLGISDERADQLIGELLHDTQHSH
ncbi:MAG: hypothetical protein RJA70_1893 [Pseudomonadota bacterium]|jgi:DnaJ-domain-containing protein 1